LPTSNTKWWIPGDYFRGHLGLFGLLLLTGGGLSGCLGMGVFGAARSNRPVFDHTLIRWWNEGGWESFTVVGAIGFLALLTGTGLALGQLRRNNGKKRVPTINLPVTGSHGQTHLRSSAVSHTLEADLKSIPDVQDALVGLFGQYPNLELHGTLTVGDRTDLDQLPRHVDAAIDRMESTTGIKPNPVQITIRFKAAEQQRRLS